MSGVLVLSRADVARLMRPADYLRAADEAFRPGNRMKAPPPVHIEAVGGSFHAKGAIKFGDRPLAALKLNGNFPENPSRGLPTIQGAILLCDAVNGAVLAIMDSIEITLKRTAAATALAAHYLARPEASVLAVCGCGDQAPAQVEALAALFRLERGYCWDKAPERATAFAGDMQATHGFAFTASQSLAAATSDADIIVTCTTAGAPFLDVEHVKPGAFIAAVGADNPHKSEITPNLMRRAKVVTDVTAQCAIMGDLHHAIDAGAMSTSDVRAELAEVVTEMKRGRTSDDEIIIFDSTGTAIQDVASAAIAFQRASAANFGERVMLV